MRAEHLELPGSWPVVRAAFEPLKVAVVWGEGSAVWASLSFGPFARVNGSVVETLEPPPFFERRRGDAVAEVNFRRLELEDVLCRAAMTCAPESSGRPLVDSLECWLTGALPSPPAQGGRSC